MRTEEFARLLSRILLAVIPSDIMSCRLNFGIDIHCVISVRHFMSARPIVTLPGNSSPSAESKQLHRPAYQWVKDPINGMAESLDSHTMYKCVETFTKVHHRFTLWLCDPLCFHFSKMQAHTITHPVRVSQQNIT